jgi:cysteine desulfurase / selenocysteine lyase
MMPGKSDTRSHFPALGQMVRGKPLVYLDSAATTLKPRVVIEALNQYYQFETANVHRGSHYLSDRATAKFEAARIKAQKFLNARSEQEIVFTSGTTDAINLISQTLGRKFLKSGDEIILSEMEHHANIVPWQMLAAEKGLQIRWAKVTDAGEIDRAHYLSLLNIKTKIVSFVHCSNTLGTVNNLSDLFSEAKKVGAWTVADAAQSVGFLSVDVQKLGCDFLAFSAHKIYGPYGIGVLYGRQEVLEMLPPYRGGGAMITSVSQEKSEYLPSPQRFEAGTPNISGVIAMAVAIDCTT